MPATMTAACVEGKTTLRAYPYVRKDALGQPTKDARELPWTVVVCRGCGANEVLTIPYAPPFSGQARWLHLLWQRLHGFTRILKGVPERGEKDTVESVAPTWQDRIALPPAEVSSLLGAKDGGVELKDAFVPFPEPEKE